MYSMYFGLGAMWIVCLSTPVRVALRYEYTDPTFMRFASLSLSTGAKFSFSHFNSVSRPDE
eukprot:8285287-Pyramimonas_sp.AAC.1